MPKEKLIEYNSSISHKNFNKELEKINQIIKDFNDWKKILDEKFTIFNKFLNNLYEIEKKFYEDILKYDYDGEEKFYDYETLLNIKELYLINDSFKSFRHDYNNNINSNFSKLSYFFINKIKDINDENNNNITINDVELFYKGNKCFFNEEIKYKKERDDNIFPQLKKLFQNCKNFIGYDPRYFKEKENEDFNDKLDDKDFHNFLLQIKNNFPKINHIAKMKSKSYYSCSNGGQIIIIKKNKDKIEIIIFTNKILFSLELSNKKLLGISEEFIQLFDSLNSDNNLKDEEYYKNYFFSKKIILFNKIDDIIQISPKLFCTFSQKVSKLFFYDINYMEIVAIISNINAIQGNSYYMHLLNNSSLIITGEEYIYIISIKNMGIKLKIKTEGLISSFCLLPKNGILCGEIKFNYEPYINPFKRDNNEYNLVQYQINEKEIKKISEKIKVHKDVIRNLFYLGNNIILSSSFNDELKIWY